MPSALYLVPRARLQQMAGQTSTPVPGSQQPLVQTVPAGTGGAPLIQNPMIAMPVFWGVFGGGLVWYIAGLMGAPMAPLIGVAAALLLGGYAYMHHEGVGWTTVNPGQQTTPSA